MYVYTFPQIYSTHAYKYASSLVVAGCVCVCPKRCAEIRLTWNELKCNNNGVAQMKLLDMNKRSFLAHTQTRIHTRANAWRQRSKQRCQASDHMRTQGKRTRQQRGGMQCAHIWLLSWCHLRHETTTTITTNNSESACWCCGGSGLRYSEFALCFVCAYQERKCKQCMNMRIYLCIFTRSGEKTGECRIFSNITHTHQKKKRNTWNLLNRFSFWQRDSNECWPDFSRVTLLMRSQKSSQLKAPKKITF